MSDAEIQPHTWAWYHDKKVPVFVLSITYEIMVPKDDLPTIVNDHTRLKYFNVTFVQQDQLSKIQPAVDELQY